MSALEPPSDDELRTALANAGSDPAIIEMFIAALHADENDEAVYGWMAEECGDRSETVERPEVP